MNRESKPTKLRYRKIVIMTDVRLDEFKQFTRDVDRRLRGMRTTANLLAGGEPPR